MATRTISFELSVSSINTAIDELKTFRDDLLEAVDLLVQKLAEDGRQIARVNIALLGAIDTGQLVNSICAGYNPATHTGLIWTDLVYAIFVEYGTGVVGSGSPHPGMWSPGPVTVGSRTYVTYDTYAHGNSGWVYFNDREGRFFWTKGQPSRPFMYNTFNQLIPRAQALFGTMPI